MPEVSFDHVIRTRRTTRVYRGEAVGEDTLKELVELATLAPSGMNLQPWRFSIVTNRDLLKQVNDTVKRVALAMLPPTDDMARYRQYLSDPDYSIFYGAPALIVIQAPRGNPVMMIDCLLGAENLILAAHAKGLGTCFMGFLLMARDNDDVRRALGVDDGYEIVAPIIVGASDAIPQAPPDRAPAQITWVK